MGCPWLPRRLAHSGPVRGGFDIAQDPPNQPLRLPGDQGQFCLEHTVTQPTSFIPGHSYRLSADDSNCLSGASHDDSSPGGFLQGTKRANFSTALLQMLRRHCKTCRTPLHAAWVAYQYKVLPFRLSLAPRTFTRCMDAAFSPLRQMRICILNYLDDWLILAQSEAVSTSYKIFLISHLGCLGLRVNFITKIILSPSQRVSFLGTVIDSVQMTATVSAERATMIQHQAASFKEDTAVRSKLSRKSWTLWQRLRRYSSG